MPGPSWAVHPAPRPSLSTVGPERRGAGRRRAPSDASVLCHRTVLALISWQTAGRRRGVTFQAACVFTVAWISCHGEVHRGVCRRLGLFPRPGAARPGLAAGMRPRLDVLGQPRGAGSSRPSFAADLKRGRPGLVDLSGAVYSARTRGRTRTGVRVHAQLHVHLTCTCTHMCMRSCVDAWASVDVRGLACTCAVVCTCTCTHTCGCMCSCVYAGTLEHACRPAVLHAHSCGRTSPLSRASHS